MIRISLTLPPATGRVSTNSGERRLIINYTNRLQVLHLYAALYCFTNDSLIK